MTEIIRVKIEETHAGATRMVNDANGEWEKLFRSLSKEDVDKIFPKVKKTKPAAPKGLEPRRETVEEFLARGGKIRTSGESNLEDILDFLELPNIMA